MMAFYDNPTYVQQEIGVCLVQLLMFANLLPDLLQHTVLQVNLYNSVQLISKHIFLIKR